MLAPSSFVSVAVVARTLFAAWQSNLFPPSDHWLMGRLSIINNNNIKGCSPTFSSFFLLGRMMGANKKQSDRGKKYRAESSETQDAPER